MYLSSGLASHNKHVTLQPLLLGSRLKAAEERIGQLEKEKTSAVVATEQRMMEEGIRQQVC